jgi:hypothetical protein
MSLPLGPLGPPRGGQDLGRNAKAGCRRSPLTAESPTIEAPGFLAGTCTDKVVLPAESVGT